MGKQWGKQGRRERGHKSQLCPRRAVNYWRQATLLRLTDTHLIEMLGEVKERIASGKGKRGHKGGNFSMLMLARDVTQMLHWAEKRQPWRGLLIAGNPADLIDVKTLLDAGYQGYRDRVLSLDEIRALHIGLLPLVGQASSAIKRMRFAVWLCLSTLCRIGELVAAKWEHIDWQAGQAASAVSLSFGVRFGAIQTVTHRDWR